jgi:hypothetical protein
VPACQASVAHRATGAADVRKGALPAIDTVVPDAWRVADAAVETVVL